MSSMSSIPQQQQQQQQTPLVFYPNSVTNQQPNPSHSNGSFGTVFIVLAVIIVISAIACFLGRLCNRKYHSQKPKASNKQNQPQNLNQNKIQPESQKFRIRPKEEDIEFGFNPKGGRGVEFGFDKMRNPKGGGGGGGIEFGFDKMRNAKEGGIEFGFDKRAPNGRPGGNGGARGANLKPSENGHVIKFAGGEPKSGAYGKE